MHDMGVKADLETLEQYSLTFCNLTEPELLIKKLQNIGYTVKEVLTPILCVLLSQQELQKAQNLCRFSKKKLEFYEGVKEQLKIFSHESEFFAIILTF